MDGSPPEPPKKIDFLPVRVDLPVGDYRKSEFIGVLATIATGLFKNVVGFDARLQSGRFICSIEVQPVEGYGPVEIAMQRTMFIQALAALGVLKTKQWPNSKEPPAASASPSDPEAETKSSEIAASASSATT